MTISRPDSRGEPPSSGSQPAVVVSLQRSHGLSAVEIVAHHRDTPGGPGAFIILGGSHDLSDGARRLGGGRCEYLRVTTSRFKALNEYARSRLAGTGAQA